MALRRLPWLAVFVIAWTPACAKKSQEAPPEQPLGPVDPNVRPHPHAAPPNPDISRDMVSSRGFGAATCHDTCRRVGGACSDQGCPVRDRSGGPDLALTVLYVDARSGQDTRRRDVDVNQLMASTCRQPLNLDQIGNSVDAVCCCPGLSTKPVGD